MGSNANKRASAPARSTASKKLKRRPDEEDEEYEVEGILDSRLDARSKQTLFLVKWKGYSEEDHTWESKESLPHARELMKEYEAAFNKATAPVKKTAPAKKAHAKVPAGEADAERPVDIDKSDVFDSDIDDDGSDDELETVAAAAPSKPRATSMTRSTITESSNCLLV